MTSILVTAEDAVIVAAKSQLVSLEGILITDVDPQLEAGLLSFLQTAGAEVMSLVGALFAKLTTPAAPVASAATPDTPSA